jgi:acyl dehydratase
MALDVTKIGSTTKPHVASIDGERAKAYAAATNDDNEAYSSGKYAPPVFGVVPTWDAIGAAVADVVPPEALAFVVHGEQDMHFHQPLVPGATVETTAQLHSIRVGSSGTRAVAKLASVDGDGRPLMDIYSTTFIRGMNDGEGGGPEKPDHTFPEAARANKVGDVTIHVDEDQTYRYRDASGDQMPIHVDDAFAKSVGLPGIIAHGLCTMAMCSQAVVNTVASGDPARLRRLAVRFAKNVLPGNDLTVSIYDAGTDDASGRRVYAFEAESAGEKVIANGRAEIEA